MDSVIDNSAQPVLAIDFDKTLCDSDYPNCGPPIPGGKEALERFRELGYKILIYSCRCCHWNYKLYGGSRDIPVLERTHVVAMRNWLIEHSIPFDEIDDGSRGKADASWTIDDKAIRFEQNWAEIAAFVEARTNGKT